LVALGRQARYSTLHVLVPSASLRAAQRREHSEAKQLLARVGLADKSEILAGRLSYGDQRRLEIARALATAPKLLLLDEPAAGMNGAEKQQLMEEIVKLEGNGLSLLIIEHDMRFVMGICREIAVLNFGQLIAQGTPAAIRGNPDVVEAYLEEEDGDSPAGKARLASRQSKFACSLRRHRSGQGHRFLLELGQITIARRQRRRQVDHAPGAIGPGRASDSSILLMARNCAAGRRTRSSNWAWCRWPRDRRFTTLTVRENLLLGGYRRRDRGEIDSDLDKMLVLFPRLKDRLGGAAGNLSGGEQQMLAIARALMARPRLLLLDEPSMGLAPLLVGEIFRTLMQLRQGGLTILLVEQNVRQALKIADVVTS
jgi:branched-chain amino acid transport system permease protein